MVTGTYLVSVAITEKKLGNPSKKDEQGRAKSLTLKLAIGVISTWALELLFCCLENGNGPDGIFLVDGLNIDGNTGYIVKNEPTFWIGNFVLLGDRMPNTYCLNRSWHTFETTGNILWLFVCLLLTVYWHYTRQKEKLANIHHNEQAARQIKLLLEPPLRRRQEMPCPPAYDAPKEDWVRWIGNSGIAMTSLIDVLGEKEGGNAAYKTAKDGIYGYREQAIDKKSLLIEHQAFGLSPQLDSGEDDEVEVMMKTPSMTPRYPRPFKSTSPLCFYK